jgi:Spy/CpxP family protein refolding chaperone
MAPSASRLASRLALACILAVSLAAPALAQQRRGPSPDQRLAHLSERLQLSEEQQAKLRPILEQENEELKAAFDQARESGKKSGFREVARPIRERTDESIQALLDEEQKGRFDALREEQRARFEKRKKMGPGGKGKPAAE